MMSPKKLVILACIVLAVVGTTGGFLLSRHKNAIVGIVNGQKIYENNLTPQEQQTLFDAQNQYYQSVEGILAKRYFEQVIADYKKSHNLNDDKLAQESYIKENVLVADDDIIAFIKENADNPALKGKSLEDQKALVQPYLLQQSAQTHFGSVLDKATESGKINVLLVQKPLLPSTQVVISANDPAIGPVNAPVTMVEFADYQCPYCNAVVPTVKSVLKKYEGKIRFVFKNYPLVQIHEQAVYAAIAAKCAKEQNKYWEMHDKLFENYKNLSNALYLRLAEQFQLNMSQFKICLENPKMQEEVMEEIEYGQKLGLKATPAFYINGKLLMGAQPQSAFEKIIDEELSKQ